MKFAIDSNILVYAFIADDDDKHLVAADLMIRASVADAILPAQVLGEFTNVIRRKYDRYVLEAAEQVSRWIATFTIVATTEKEVLHGARFALYHRMQTWDSIIWQVTATAGASYLVSEDMQDGVSIDGVTVINPFNNANAALLDTLLAPIERVERT